MISVTDNSPQQINAALQNLNSQLSLSKSSLNSIETQIKELEKKINATPEINPFEQVNSDWTATSGKALILNKPNLSAVATTGSYNDLTNKPNLATVATTGRYNDLTNKPNLAAVATTGSYNDLTNKPSLATIATTGSYNDLIDIPPITLGEVSTGVTFGAVGIVYRRLLTLTNITIPAGTSTLTSSANFWDGVSTIISFRIIRTPIRSSAELPQGISFLELNCPLEFNLDTKVLTIYNGSTAFSGSFFVIVEYTKNKS